MFGKSNQPNVGTEKFSKTNDDTLERSLRPIYLTSYYTGILQDWYREHHRPGRSIRTLQYISTTVVFLMLSSMLGFEIFQLGSGLSKITSIHSILPNLLWICTFQLSLMVLIRFHFYRYDFISFFDKWRRLEVRLVYVNASSSINWLSKFMGGSYAFMGFGLVAGLYFLIQRQPNICFFPPLWLSPNAEMVHSPGSKGHSRRSSLLFMDSSIFSRSCSCTDFCLFSSYPQRSKLRSRAPLFCW